MGRHNRRMVPKPTAALIGRVPFFFFTKNALSQSLEAELLGHAGIVFLRMREGGAGANTVTALPQAEM